MSDKLSDCPFCGDEAETEKIEEGCYGVGCGYCDFQLMSGNVGIGWHESEAAAIAAWNRRASPAPAIPAEPVPPFGWVQPRGGNYFTRSELSAKRVGGLIPVWTTPPTSAAPAISESEDARDAARYRWLQRQRAHVWHEIADMPINRTNERIDAAIDAARDGGGS